MKDARTYFSSDDLSRLHVVRRLTSDRLLRLVAMTGGLNETEREAGRIDVLLTEPQLRNLVAVINEMLGPEQPRRELWRDEG